MVLPRRSGGCRHHDWDLFGGRNMVRLQDWVECWQWRKTQAGKSERKGTERNGTEWKVQGSVRPRLTLRQRNGHLAVHDGVSWMRQAVGDMSVDLQNLRRFSICLVSRHILIKVASQLLSIYADCRTTSCVCLFIVAHSGIYCGSSVSRPCSGVGGWPSDNDSAVIKTPSAGRKAIVAEKSTLKKLTKNKIVNLKGRRISFAYDTSDTENKSQSSCFDKKSGPAQSRHAMHSAEQPMCMPLATNRHHIDAWYISSLPCCNPNFRLKNAISAPPHSPTVLISPLLNLTVFNSPSPLPRRPTPKCPMQQCLPLPPPPPPLHVSRRPPTSLPRQHLLTPRIPHYRRTGRTSTPTSSAGSHRRRRPHRVVVHKPLSSGYTSCPSPTSALARHGPCKFHHQLIPASYLTPHLIQPSHHPTNTLILLFACVTTQRIRRRHAVLREDPHVRYPAESWRLGCRPAFRPYSCTHHRNCQRPLHEPLRSKTSVHRRWSHCHRLWHAHVF